MQPRPLTAYTINVDETLARVSDALQSALDKLPNSNIEITDDVKGYTHGTNCRCRGRCPRNDFGQP